MTTTVLVDTDTLSSVDLANNIEVVNRALVKWGLQWGITAVVTADKTLPFDAVAHITNMYRHTGAYGYHTVENGVQLYNVGGGHTVVPPKDHIPAGSVPTSYISPAALLNSVYGYYAPATYSKAITSFGKVIRPAKLRTVARYREGVCSVLVHEILEMLADSHIDKLSSPDKTGACWLIEVADHVSGYYTVDNVGGNTCVVPAATYPSYYSLTGKAPFDSGNDSATPFDTTSPSFYGYTQDSKGVLTAIPKGSVRHA